MLARAPASRTGAGVLLAQAFFLEEDDMRIATRAERATSSGCVSACFFVVGNLVCPEKRRIGLAPVFDLNRPWRGDPVNVKAVPHKEFAVSPQTLPE